MKKKTIYSTQSQELLRLFEEAGNSSKIMCVPLDYAKKDHVVMFCNGYGGILRKPFSVKNSPEGINYLTEQVRRSCRHRRYWISSGSGARETPSTASSAA